MRQAGITAAIALTSMRAPGTPSPGATHPLALRARLGYARWVFANGHLGTLQESLAGVILDLKRRSTAFIRAAASKNYTAPS